uniref:Uncharacterized protein n=1 Tax=Caenorhabditis japonica TaxID=281687 RepID=A0A8R1IBQ5_CAEJA
MELRAHKCFKTELIAKTFSFLSIYHSTVADVGRRESISVDECRKAVAEKKYVDQKLEEISPGVYRSNSTEHHAKNQTGWMGTKEYSFFELTVQTGNVATMDGKEIISNLGPMKECSFDAGSCKKDEFTIVWEAQHTNTLCPYEYAYTSSAITNNEFLAIEETGVFSSIDRDIRKVQQVLHICSMSQAMLMDDGLLVEFPEIQNRKFNLDYVKRDNHFGRGSAEPPIFWKDLEERRPSSKSGRTFPHL